jgi:two-component system, NarL family, response regulator LiaR
MYGVLVAAIFLIIGLYFGKDRSSMKEAIKPNVQSENNKIMLSPIATFLSKREQEVLLYMAKGLTNLEIADQLFISENTVKTHTSRIFEKLQVKNRTSALIKAKEAGIIKELM